MTPTGRDNGLPRAARYVALLDVAAPMADHVLAVLRDAGVTALAEADGDSATERVHVDLERADIARAVVADALPGLAAGLLGTDAGEAGTAPDADELADDEVDSLFAGIVAGWDTASADPVPRWSALEDVEGPADDGATGSGTDTLPPVPPPPSPRPPLSSRLVRRSDPAARRPDDVGRHDGDLPDDPDLHDDDHDGFVPPEPPPLPEVDRVTRMAWAALIGGPTLIILAGIFGIPLEGWLALLSLGLFLGGFATLVGRMRDRPRDDDGWDDGAVL